MLTAPGVGHPRGYEMDLRDFAALPAMARFLHSNFNVEVLRTNTLMMKDDWTMLDERVVEVSSTILNGVADLETMGLVIDE